MNDDVDDANTAAKVEMPDVAAHGKADHGSRSIDERQRLTQSEDGIIRKLGSPPGVEDVDFEIPTFDDVARAANFD